MNITIEHTTKEGIPLLLFIPENAKAAPVVFVLHGFFSDKESGAELSLRLAEAGFAVFAPDAPLHGERRGERLDQIFTPGPGKIYPPESGLDAFLLMLELTETVERDVERLAQLYAEDPRLDWGRVGVTGQSFGGMAAFYVAARNPRICAAAPMISLPSFLSRWQDVLLEASAYPQWTAQMEAVKPETEQRTEVVRAVDPMEGLKSFAPRPLLILCGDRDLDMPKTYAVQAARELQPAYRSAPERLKLMIYDGVDHRVTGPMMADCIAWFKEHL